jgi:hypothetical protein
MEMGFSPRESPLQSGRGVPLLQHCANIGPTARIKWPFNFYFSAKTSNRIDQTSYGVNDNASSISPSLGFTRRGSVRKIDSWILRIRPLERQFPRASKQDSYGSQTKEEMIEHE